MLGRFRADTVYAHPPPSACAAAPGPACLSVCTKRSGSAGIRMEETLRNANKALTSKTASVPGGCCCCCCRRCCPPVHSAPGRLNARRTCGLGLRLRVHGEDIHYYREPSCPSRCCWPSSLIQHQSEGRSQAACWLVEGRKGSEGGGTGKGRRGKRKDRRDKKRHIDVEFDAFLAAAAAGEQRG